MRKTVNDKTLLFDRSSIGKSLLCVKKKTNTRYAKAFKMEMIAGR